MPQGEAALPEQPEEESERAPGPQVGPTGTGKGPWSFEALWESLPEASKSVSQWQQGLGKAFEDSGSLGAAAEVMVQELFRAPTKFGQYLRDSCWQHRPPLAEGQEGGPVDLFPMAPRAAAAAIDSLESLQAGPPIPGLAAWTWALAMICSFFSVAGWTENPIERPPLEKLNAGQKRAIAHFYQAAFYVLKSPRPQPSLKEVRADLKARLRSYGGGHPWRSCASWKRRR